MTIGGDELDQPSTEGVDFGRTVVGEASTNEVILSPTESTGSIIIRAEVENAGQVFLGFDDSVDDTNGFQMEAGDVISMDIDALSQPIFVFALNANDAVRFMALN